MEYFNFILSFLSGTCVASWGFYFREFTPVKIRLHTAAEVLICSNMLMVVLNMAAAFVHPYLGLILSILALLAALLLLLVLPVKEPSSTSEEPWIKKST